MSDWQSNPRNPDMSDPPDGRLKITPTTLPDNAGLADIEAIGQPCTVPMGFLTLVRDVLHECSVHMPITGTNFDDDLILAKRQCRAIITAGVLRPSVWMDISTAPKGFVMVPVEPSPEMIAAADATCPIVRGSESHRMGGGATPEDFYRAMIAAHLCDHDWQHNTEAEEVCMKCGSSRPTPPKAHTP